MITSEESNGLENVTVTVAPETAIVEPVLRVPENSISNADRAGTLVSSSASENVKTSSVPAVLDAPLM